MLGTTKNNRLGTHQFDGRLIVAKPRNLRDAINLRYGNRGLSCQRLVKNGRKSNGRDDNTFTIQENLPESTKVLEIESNLSVIVFLCKSYHRIRVAAIHVRTICLFGGKENG